MNHTVGVISLGCSKNRVDTEQMLGLLREWGYSITANPSQADVLIVNTCGFIESAKQESIDTILELATYKQKGVCRLLVVTGCLVQRYAQELADALPEVDALVGVGGYPQLRSLLAQAMAGERPIVCPQSMDVFYAPRVLTTPQYYAYVRTGDGCDNRCTYCAIPLIRGPYRSRPYAQVLEEAQALAGDGVRELVYIAQDTTRFGDDLPDRPRLADLVQDTCRIDAVRWVRVLYCYPSRVDEHLLDILAEEPKACPYIDLPLQHIDGDLLRAMHRQGSPELIRDLVQKIQARGLTLRTTMIVGFPGETEAAFERLLDFVRETRFDRLGAFAYSVEENTPAADLPGQVPEEIKLDRLDRLMRLQRRISLENNQKRIGEVCEALVESVAPRKIIARSMREAPEEDGKIILRAKTPLNPGDFVTVRIDGAHTYDLTGAVL